MGAPLVLASSSVARANLLRACGLDFEIEASGASEAPLAGDAAARTLGLAVEKARTVAARRDDGSCVIGCDTLLESRFGAVGKFLNVADALVWWMAHRRSTVTAVTAQIVALGSRRVGGVTMVRVSLGDFSRTECAEYLSEETPLSAAGALAIQSLGSAFVDSIDGDPTALIGLSMSLLRRQLRSLDLDLLSYLQQHPSVP